MAASYELSKSSNGKFRFVLKAGNGQTILTSQLYASRTTAQNGIASVQKNSQDDAKYERKAASNGKFMFNLKATNGQVVGTSEVYESERARDAGIESVKRNGPTTDVRDKTASK